MSARPALTFLVDVPGWAYDNIAQQITPALREAYAVTRLYIQDFPDLADLMVALGSAEQPGLLHVFWRPMLFDMLDRSVLARAERKAGWAAGEALARLSRHIITTSVYDHLGLDPDGARRQVTVLAALDGYATSSPILDRLYREIPGMPAPSAMLADGVDPAFYHPPPTPRTGPQDDLVIGWVGNSQWGFLEGLPDAKGLETIIKPALAMARAAGHRITFVPVDRAERWRPREEVARIYREIDLYLCASLVEGTPNPVLEAMASGVPILSTDVGIVRMVLGPEQQRFVVAREPRAFAEAIGVLAADPALRRKLAAENLSQIADHHWMKRHDDWLSFFAQAYAHGAIRSTEARHAALRHAAADLRPTLKMRIRSLLRRSPLLYRLSSRALHLVTSKAGILRIWLRRTLDRT